jgi:hypothetical protein
MKTPKYGMYILINVQRPETTEMTNDGDDTNVSTLEREHLDSYYLLLLCNTTGNGREKQIA